MSWKTFSSSLMRLMIEEARRKEVTRRGRYSEGSITGVSGILARVPALEGEIGEISIETGEGGSTGDISKDEASVR